ncbi:FAD-dependent oxidoreductase [Bizionia sediminis]|uniref:FAD-dependent oxidoreductase n=1 Tax=Bizionia sediminis TaxID=1737064 RepID=A0ABW5KUK7_9FLAO
MKKEAYNIHIIGAGISGLIAAHVLENQGYSPVILEASNAIGGRVKTDIVSNYQLDHGFQVLLTSYPAAQKYLDYNALNLQHFLPGATIFSKGQQKTIGDPLRNLSLLVPTLFSGIGNFSDKKRILKLNAQLKSTRIETIFNKPEKTTLNYLVDFGFSEGIISNFFKPFFAGIFLETELNTSSRMFEFVYKMFGSGYAAIPTAGIAAIPKQLEKNLNKTTIHLNTPVKKVEESQIILANGSVLESHFTIIATQPNSLTETNTHPETPWKSCHTFYYETKTRAIKKPLIGLIADQEAYINNIVYHTALKTASAGSGELLSVTVVKKHTLSEQALQNQVEKELVQYLGNRPFKFLKHYHIKQALPDLNNLKYSNKPNETQLTPHIFLAGDTMLNGSLNAAMLSGESAAKAVIEAISKQEHS